MKTNVLLIFGTLTLNFKVHFSTLVTRKVIALQDNGWFTYHRLWWCVELYNNIANQRPANRAVRPYVCVCVCACVWFVWFVNFNCITGISFAYRHILSFKLLCNVSNTCIYLILYILTSTYTVCEKGVLKQSPDPKHINTPPPMIFLDLLPELSIVKDLSYHARHVEFQLVLIV